MENRQYSHELPGLERVVYREITPSILDVPPIRKGYDPLRDETGSKFALALNLYLFRDVEVEFSILKERFLRMSGDHAARKCGDITMAQRCVYYFFIPDFVNIDWIVVEWYKDHCVYICERRPTPVRSVFGPSDEEDGGDLPESSSKEVEESTAEDVSVVKDVASQTAPSGEEKEPDEDASNKESLSVECGSERDLTDVSIEEESVSEDVCIVSPKAGPSSQKDPLSEEGGEELLAEAGPSQRESLPERAASGEEEETSNSLESCTRKIREIFQKANKNAEGRRIRPIFVDRNYKPESDALDIERQIDDQRIRNRILQRDFFRV